MVDAKEITSQTSGLGGGVTFLTSSLFCVHSRKKGIPHMFMMWKSIALLETIYKIMEIMDFLVASLNEY